MSQFSNEVVGPLTDAELRATPVPTTVSGSVAVSNFPATQAVTGPLTNTELRASPVPVTQGGTPTATVSRITVSASVVTLQAANSARKRLIIHNETGTLFVKLGTNATDQSYSYRLTANTMCEIDFYTGDVTAIKASGSSFALVTEIA